MIICGRETVNFLNLAVVVRNASGVPVAADAAPVARFYRVDPATGLLALDLLVGTNGLITMTALSGQTGVYSCPVEVAEMTHPQYQVLVTYAVSASARTESQGVMFIDAFDTITKNSVTPAASIRLTMGAS